MNAVLEVAEKLGISLTPGEKAEVFWGNYQPVFDAIRQTLSGEMESLSRFREDFKRTAYMLRLLILHADELQDMFQTGLIGSQYREPLERMVIAIKISEKYFSEAIENENA